MTTSNRNTVPAGYVRRAHGIRGDVVIRGLVEDIADRLAVGATVDTNEDPPRILTVEAHHTIGDDFRIRFNGIDDRTAAEALRGIQIVIARTDRRPLEPGEWWPEDLVGCQVVSPTGEPIGELVEVIVAGVQDRLVVTRPDGETAEVPLVEVLVPEVDLEANIVVVDLPGGLFAI